MRSDFGRYTEDTFFDDMARVTQNRTDPDLCEILVSKATRRCTGCGARARFLPQFGRQSFKVDGKFTFWGGATLAAVGGGRGWSTAYTGRRRRPACRFSTTPGPASWSVPILGVTGVVVKLDGATRTFQRGASCSPAAGSRRTRRGAPAISDRAGTSRRCAAANTTRGDGLEMALRIGAQPCGHWSGCHAVGWERYAEDFGCYRYRRLRARQLSVLDHGEQRRPALPRRGRGHPKLHLRQVRPHHPPAARAVRLADLRFLGIASAAAGVPQQARDQGDREHHRRTGGQAGRCEPRALETIRAFNAAVKRDVPFNPNVKDGQRTGAGNSEVELGAHSTTPFEAYAVTCGITFTFGGVKIDTDARVIDTNGRRSPASMPRARWSAACSISIIPALPALRAGQYSAAWPGEVPPAHRARQPLTSHSGKRGIGAGYDGCRFGLAGMECPLCHRAYSSISSWPFIHSLTITKVPRTT